MALVIVGSFAFAMTSCDGGKKAAEATAKMKADSTRVADSLVQVKAEAEAMLAAKAKMVRDSIAKADSIAQAAVKKVKKK